MSYPTAYNTLTPEDIQVAVDVLQSGRVTMGSEVDAFEREFAEYVGSKYAVMVNSGSSADFVTMLAAVETGLLKRGDLVSLPAVTWPTQAWACILAGLKVRLLDVDLNTLQAKDALFATHLMGNVAVFDTPPMFEDCCEALGARLNGKHVGTFGHAGAFSFYFSHHITTMEGGMIVTDSEGFADCCRMLRAHGWVRDLRNAETKRVWMQQYDDVDERFLFVGPGLNFRPTEIAAAIGRNQLKRVDEMNRWRNEHFEFIRTHYSMTAADTYAVRADYRAQPAWFAAPFILRPEFDRREVMAHLRDCGIETRPIVGGNLARQPAFRRFFDMSSTPLPNADIVHRQGFYVGLPPHKADLWSVTQSLGWTKAMSKTLAVSV